MVLLICKGKALTWAVFHEKQRKGEEMVMHPVMRTECILGCILDCFLEGDPSQWRWLALHLGTLEEGPHSAWCSVPVEDERSSVRGAPWVGLVCTIRVFGCFSAGVFAVVRERG